MAKKSARIPLNVFLNARLVGRLRRETSGAIHFQYDESWLSWENTFPASLSLPLREDRYVGDPVIAVFDNLLPDNKEIRERVAAHSGANGVDPYSLLAAIGRDCVGALQFLPDGEDPGKAGAVEGKPASDKDIADILSNLASAPLGIGADKGAGHVRAALGAHLGAILGSGPGAAARGRYFQVRVKTLRGPIARSTALIVFDSSPAVMFVMEPKAKAKANPEASG